MAPGEAGAVALVVHRFPSRITGGTELYTLNLARGLLGRGWHVEVYTYGPGDTRTVRVEQDEVLGIPVRRLTYDQSQTANPMREEYDSARVAESVQALWKQAPPQVVHITHPGYLGTAVIDAARQEGLPVALTLTDFWAICPTGRLLRHDGSLCQGPTALERCLRCVAHMGPRGARYAAWVDRVPGPLWRMGAGISAWPLLRMAPGVAWLRALARRPAVVCERLLQAQALLCPGRFLRDVLIANGYPGERLEWAPHGIEQPERLRRSAPPAERTPLRLGYIGPLAAHKGVDVVVDAFRLLYGDVAATLACWGSAPEGDAFADALCQRIAETPNASYRGCYLNDRVTDVLEELDVLVVPSTWYENTPTVIYEALASGTPVIASDLGGMRELVHGYRGGWLFPRGDAQALSRLFSELAANPGLVRDAAEGIATVPTFAQHLARVEAIYQSILRSKSQ
ncbi:MAG: glycosyltransferase [Anaerolineae bacterium]